MKHSDPFFPASWDPKIRIVTFVVGAVCLTITASLWPVISAEGPGSMHFWAGLLPTFILLGGALLAVKGYGVIDGELQAQRLLWRKRFPLSDLESVQRVPELVRQSRSLLGNSGFFGFMGLFKHPEIGAYRALVTNPSTVVLLRFGKRSLAVSPADPESFIARLLEHQPTIERLPDPGKE